MTSRWACILVATLFISACHDQETIKVGFLGSLSGRAGEVSQSARDGALLAIEEYNHAGGLNGRKVELVVYDDQHNEDNVIAGVKSFAEAGVVGVIGPITSQMSVAALPEANKRKVVLVSPTTSTVELNDKDDYFFRTIATCDANARNLAIYTSKELGMKRMAILKDLSNSAFTDPWQYCFSDQAKQLGNEIVATATYSSLDNNFSLNALAKELLAKGPDAILVLTSSIDAALFSQQVRKTNKSVQLLGSDWSYSGDLIRYGGKSVERFTFTTNLDMNSKTPDFLSFQEKFQTRFAATPKFPSVLAFESAQFLLKGLSESQGQTPLIESLAQIASIKGLQGELKINRYGDTQRATHINEVRNGQIVRTKQMN